jgi:hypothetical protein
MNSYNALGCEAQSVISLINKIISQLILGFCFTFDSVPISNQS